MSSDEAARDRDGPGHDRTIILRAASSFDGRDHEMSAEAFELHIMAIAHSTANDRPGFVPDESLSSLTGEALRSLGAEPATLAAELCTDSMWERSDGGYRILDVRAVQVCVDHQRELGDQDKRTLAPDPQHHAGININAPGLGAPRGR